MSAPYDVVLWGASGFTGRLVAEYLATNYPDLSWAIAGRDQAKLEGIRASLPGAGKDAPILIGDSHDLASLEAIAAQTKVVCTTVGPYAKYGTPMVEACTKLGAGYCDLTGEALWIKSTIEQFHERAKQTGARIVHCCGFDSIPSDIGCWMLHQHLVEHHGRRLGEAHLRVLKLSGGFSGGTVDSMVSFFEAAKDPAVRRAAGDPYVLYPQGVARGQDRGDQMKPLVDEHTGRWTAPFIMASINTRLVRRTNALLDFAYGEGFRYDEATDMGSGLRGAARAYGLSLGLGGFAGAMSIGPARRLLQKTLLPAPGEGPSQQARDRGSFRIAIVAKAADEPGKPAIALRGLVEGDKDPGYGETSKMLGESAVCLARQANGGGGVLTPASAMGTALLERLRAAGMVFRVEER